MNYHLSRMMSTKPIWGLLCWIIVQVSGYGEVFALYFLTLLLDDIIIIILRMVPSNQIYKETHIIKWHLHKFHW